MTPKKGDMVDGHNMQVAGNACFVRCVRGEIAHIGSAASYPTVPGGRKRAKDRTRPVRIDALKFKYAVPAKEGVRAFNVWALDAAAWTKETMTMSKTATQHTPGPWHVTPAGYVVTDNFEFLPIIHPFTETANRDKFGCATPEAMANAQFVSATPELYSAAESLVTLWEEWAHDSSALAEPLRRSLEMRVEEARAAIAKATGGETPAEVTALELAEAAADEAEELATEAEGEADVADRYEYNSAERDRERAYNLRVQATAARDKADLLK